MIVQGGKINRPRLLSEMTGALNLKELRQACFELGINHEDLSQGGPTELAMELILYCERHNRIDDLLNYLQLERPNTDWKTVYHLDDDVPGGTGDDRDSQQSSATSSQSNMQDITDYVLDESSVAGDSQLLSENSSPSIAQDTDAVEDSDLSSGPSREPQFRALPSLIINILLFVIFLLLVTYWFTPALPPNIVFCATDLVVTISLALIILLILHFFWRVLSPALNSNADQGNIELFGVQIPLGSVKAIIDNSHPWVLSDRIFIGGIFAIIVAIAFFGLAPWSPTNQQPTAPVLANFTILLEEDSALPVTLPFGQPLQLPRGQTANINAVTGLLKGLSCEWKPEEGTITSQDGCTVTYVAPKNSGIYFLGLEVSSPCSLKTLTHGLFINVP